MFSNLELIVVGASEIVGFTPQAELIEVGDGSIILKPSTVVSVRGRAFQLMFSGLQGPALDLATLDEVYLDLRGIHETS